MPRDITITFGDGSSHVYAGAPDDATPEQVQARAEKEFGKPVTGLDGGKKGVQVTEVGRVAGKVVQEGVMGVPGAVGDAALFVGRNADKLPWSLPTAGTKLARMIPGVGDAIDATKFGDVSNFLKTLGGAVPMFEPETSTGKAVGNIGGTVLGNILTGGAGSVASKAVLGLGAGAGGEAAARLTDDNPLARILGALLGGGGVAAAQTMKPNAQTLVQQSTKHITKEDWAQAKVLEATLKNEGIDHLKSQLLGPRSTLDDVVAQAGTNPAARPKLVTKVTNAADQSKGAVDRWSLTNLPVVTGERREVLDDIQGAAQMAINQAKGRANTAYTTNMPPVGTQYTPEGVRQLYDSLREVAKSSKYGETSDAGKAILRLADDLMLPDGKLDTSGANRVMLQRAQKAGQDLATVPGVQMVREPVTDAHKLNNLIKELNLKSQSPDYKGLPIADVKDIMKAFTNNFNPARDAKSAVMTGEVNPMQKGLAGDIANMGGGIKPTRYTAKDTALDMVFPKDKAQPNEIIALEKAVGADGVGTLLREYFTRAAGRTFHKDVPEMTTGQPAKFSQAITGTQEQRANVDAALHIVAKSNGVNPAGVRAGFKKLIDALDSFQDLKLPSQIDRASLNQEAGKNLASFVVAPNSRVGRYWNEKVMAKTYNQIADLVTSPEGLKKLAALSTSPRRDLAQQMAITIAQQAMMAESMQDEK